MKVTPGASRVLQHNSNYMNKIEANNLKLSPTSPISVVKLTVFCILGYGFYHSYNEGSCGGINYVFLTFYLISMFSYEPSNFNIFCPANKMPR